MKTFFSNIYYRIKWWTIKNTTYHEKEYPGMKKTIDYNFSLATLDKYFSRWFMMNSEIGPTKMPSVDCLKDIPGGVRLSCKKNFDSTTYPKTPVYIGYLNTKTRFEQKYGMFELIAKVPEGEGTYWPAFWFYGDGNDPLLPPEIDQFEMMATEGRHSKETHRISATVHWNDNGHEQQGRMLRLRQDLSKNYHKYGLKWTKDRLTWYLDDIPFYTLKNRYHIPMYIVINISTKWPYSIKNEGKYDVKKLIVNQFI